MFIPILALFLSIFLFFYVVAIARDTRVSNSKRQPSDWEIAREREQEIWGRYFHDEKGNFLGDPIDGALEVSGLKSKQIACEDCAKIRNVESNGPNRYRCADCLSSATHEKYLPDVVVEQTIGGNKFTTRYLTKYQCDTCQKYYLCPYDADSSRCPSCIKTPLPDALASDHLSW